MEAEAVVMERRREPPQMDVDRNPMEFQIDFLPRQPKEKVSEEEVERRRLRWDALAERIEELIAQLGFSNVETISYQLRDLEDLIVGPGLVANAFLRYQMQAPHLTSVYAAAVAVVNSKFHMAGRILLGRIIFFIHQVFVRRQLQPDTDEIMNVVTFFAHLINQQVVRLAAASELLSVLLTKPSNQNVHIARHFVAECASSIQSLTASYIYRKCIGVNNIVHGGPVAKKILRAAREFGAIIANAKAQSSPAGRPELDLVNEEDQYTHLTCIYNRAVHPHSEFDTFSSSFFSPGEVLIGKHAWDAKEKCTAEFVYAKSCGLCDLYSAVYCVSRYQVSVCLFFPALVWNSVCLARNN